MSRIGIVYKKELLDTIRDRRTIISMIVIPVIVFPLLTIGFSSFAISMAEKSAGELHPIGIVGEQNDERLGKMLRDSQELTVVDVGPDSIKEDIEAKKIRAAVVIPEDFQEKILAEDTTSLEIIYNAAETKSDFAADKIAKILGDYRNMILEERLGKSGLNTGILKPFETHRVNIADDKMGSFILSMFLPYVIIILSMIGAMYTAIDLNAGEKERGTLETILVAPIPRWQLATGKFFTILTTSLVSTILSITSMTLTMMFGIYSAGPAAAELGMKITPAMILVIALMMIPTACLFSAMLMTVSIVAKSYKEAQSYVSPLMFLVIVPALISFIPGVELDLKLAFVPLVNISLAIREALMGNINLLYIAIIFVSTVMYAAFAIFVTHRIYEKESVMFRS